MAATSPPTSEGVLVLAGTPLGRVADASPRLREELAGAEVIAAEDTRRLRRLLADLDVVAAGRIVSYFEGNEEARTPALLDEAAGLYHGQKAGLDQAQIREALDPGRFIAARTIRGGPAPAESLRQADHFTQGLVADEQTVAGIKQRLADAARKLEAAIDTILGGSQ